MSQQFYDLAEACEKMGQTEDELKQLVRDGQLREFRDGGQIKYKTEEVDMLAENLATLSGSLGGTSGELILEPSDESSSGLTGSDMLTLEEADQTEADGTVIDGKKDDTVITSVGISVFDDEDMPDAADPGAVTVLAEEDKTGSSLSLDSLGSGGLGGTASGTGSGSGLLDLSRESDDTSLGAELLDEIYSEDQEAGIPDMGEATRAGLEGTEAEKAAPPEPTEQPLPVAAAAPSPAAVVRVTDGGAIDTALGVAMIPALLILGVGGITLSASLQGVVPSFLQTMHQKLPIVGGVFAGITLLGFIIGFVVGRRADR